MDVWVERCRYTSSANRFFFLPLQYQHVAPSLAIIALPILSTLPLSIANNASTSSHSFPMDSSSLQMNHALAFTSTSPQNDPFYCQDRFTFPTFIRYGLLKFENEPCTHLCSQPTKAWPTESNVHPTCFLFHFSPFHSKSMAPLPP